MLPRALLLVSSTLALEQLDIRPQTYGKTEGVSLPLSDAALSDAALSVTSHHDMSWCSGNASIEVCPERGGRRVITELDSLPPGVRLHWSYRSKEPSEILVRSFDGIRRVRIIVARSQAVLAIHNGISNKCSNNAGAVSTPTGHVLHLRQWVYTMCG
jgi:hypothetical protein